MLQFYVWKDGIPQRYGMAAVTVAVLAHLLYTHTHTHTLALSLSRSNTALTISTAFPFSHPAPFILSKDFEILTVEELKKEPFSFRAGHLRKITTFRENKTAAAATDTAHTNAAQITAAQLQSQAPVQTTDHETASAASGSTRSRTSAAPARTAFLPTAPKTKQLLPNGKHAFLSYQWDVQEQVKEIKGMLNERQIKCTDATLFLELGDTD